MYLMDFFFGVVLLLACIIATRLVLRKPSFDTSLMRKRLRVAKSMSYFDVFRQF